MLTGLLINDLGPLFDVSKPLSLLPLMLSLNSFILFGGVLVYLRGGDVRLLHATTSRSSPLALLFMVLPILSVLGAFWVNTFGNNSILLLLMTTICLLFAFGVVSKGFLPPKFFPLAVLLIAISILLHSSLISNYMTSFGSDNPVEYFVFKVTESNAHWSSVFMHPWDTTYGRINSMLSVTVLPTLYSSLLNMDATWVMKVIYPLIFSLVPLALYRLWQKNLGDKTAFIASFLFMAQNTFYTELLGLNRQIVAEFFFVLLLLVVFGKKKNLSSEMLCFTVFSFALVTSHYALAEIFLLFISFVWIYLLIMKRPSRNITVTTVAFFFVVMFSWYIYTSNAAVFDSFVSFGNYVYDQLGQFFDPTSRDPEILRGLGLESPPTVWNTVSRVFAYLTELFIFVGFVSLITRRKNVQLKKEYLIFTVMAVVLLGALIAVPGLANTMNMTRFYHILLFFLAPLCVLGAEFVVKLVSKWRTELWVSILLLVVLVPYFLFQTGFVYEMTGVQSWSLPLSKHRMDTVFLRSAIGYFDECEVLGALWMSENIDVEDSKIYADSPSLYSVLTSYGMIYRGNMEVLSNVTVISADANVYFSRANVVNGIIVGSDLWNTSELAFPFSDLNTVYTNGGSEIYRNTP
jgi:uncharacterized membrane protein